MRRSFQLHLLSTTEFEDLVVQICTKLLGIGTLAFADGKDGGRDAAFSGTAQKFPSAASPLSGNFIIQAKQTTNPAGTCSSSEFKRVMDGEKKKIISLVAQGELDHYLVFTNRKKPAVKTIAIEKGLKKLKLKSATILGAEQIRTWLTAHPGIWKNMGFDRFEKRLEIQQSDLLEIVSAFHSALKAEIVDGEHPEHFPFIVKPKKNRLNGLTKPYFEFMERDSLPFFSTIEDFLKNPRNESYRALYDDTTHEIKGKIIAHAADFENFDQALTYVADLVSEGSSLLKGMRRFVTIFLHYMYYTCDIGQHA